MQNGWYRNARSMQLHGRLFRGRNWSGGLQKLTEPHKLSVTIIIIIKTMMKRGTCTSSSILFHVSWVSSSLMWGKEILCIAMPCGNITFGNHLSQPVQSSPKTCNATPQVILFFTSRSLRWKSEPVQRTVCKRSYNKWKTNFFALSPPIQVLVQRDVCNSIVRVSKSINHYVKKKELWGSMYLSSASKKFFALRIQFTTTRYK